MGNNELFITSLSDDDMDRIEELVDETDTSKSFIGRTRLRAGMRLWDAGNLNKDLLDAFVENKSTDNEADANIKNDAAAVIHRNLSTNDPIPLRNDDEDDLVDIITEEILKDALTELQRNNDIEHVPGEGYIKK